MEFPAPVIRVAVEPKTRADQDKLGTALQRLAQEDPSFNVSTDQETGQTIIAGMGELHLEIIVDRMKREFGVEANVGKPQVAYRETITQPAPGKASYKRQTGGRGQYGHAEIEIEPAPGEGFVFENKIIGGVIPKRVHQADRGGHPRRDGARLPRRLRDGGHPRPPRLRLVPRGRFRRALVPHRRLARVPGRAEEGQAGAARADHARRGRDARRSTWARSTATSTRGAGGSRSMETRPGGAQVITALVPLSEMFGYTTDLRSATQGRATSTMHFDALRAGAEEHRRRGHREGAGSREVSDESMSDRRREALTHDSSLTSLSL